MYDLVDLRVAQTRRTTYNIYLCVHSDKPSCLTELSYDLIFPRKTYPPNERNNYIIICTFRTAERRVKTSDTTLAAFEIIRRGFQHTGNLPDDVFQSTNNREHVLTHGSTYARASDAVNENDKYTTRFE